MTRMSTAALIPALVALLMTGLLTLQWRDWPPPPPADAPASGPVPPPDAGAGAEDPLSLLTPPEPRERYISVTDRTLFRPGRRPPDPADQAADAAASSGTATPLDQFDLTAVLLTPGQRSAWVRDASQQNIRRLRPGDDLEGWSIRDILPDRVLLERQGERNTLLLRDYAKAPATTTPGAPVPPRPRPARPRPPQPQPPEPTAPPTDPPRPDGH